MGGKDLQELANIKNAIQNSSRIAVLAHKNPDGDAFGSVLALHEYLERIGKISQPVTVGPINTEHYGFMPLIDTFQLDFDPEEFDLIISCDSGAEHMTGFYDKYPELFKNHPKLINIDHHPSNNFFGGQNIVVTDSPSTTFWWRVQRHLYDEGYLKFQVNGTKPPHWWHNRYRRVHAWEHNVRSISNCSKTYCSRRRCKKNHEQYFSK